MGAIEETRKVIQDFLAPEIRTLSAKMESLVEEQGKLRTDLRAEIAASEVRIVTAIDRLRNEMTSVARNAVLEQALVDKQRLLDELQKQPH